MTAWMIITARIHDREAFMTGYGPAAAALVERFGGRYVVRAPGAALLEGEGMDGASVVVSEWPNRAAAEAFWTSADYAEVRKLRDGLADVQVMLVGD
jgi:uncharacterized protein (DUF1330 family)